MYCVIDIFDHVLVLLLLSDLDLFVQVHEYIQLNEEYQLIDPTNNLFLKSIFTLISQSYNEGYEGSS